MMHRIRSFVRREGRMTDGQKRAVAELLPRYGLSITAGETDFADAFGRVAPVVIEIGFGTGHSLLAAAMQYPDINFVGIETHLPGVGSLLAGIEAAALRNVRVYHADAVTVLQTCIAPNTLAGIQIFFPDPWPKRKHHKRRLIQAEFVAQLSEKLLPGGWLHLATDWQEYAQHMLTVLMACPTLQNQAESGRYADRSLQRPVITRFEKRGQAAGRQIYELQFVKKEG